MDKSVPLEPTIEMENAGDKADHDYSNNRFHGLGHLGRVAFIYHHMLAAAPQPEPAAGETPRTDAIPVISEFVANLFSAFFFLFEDSEEIEPFTYKFDSEQWNALISTIEATEHALQDRPGYVCDYPDKTKYAIEQLERSLSAAQEAYRATVEQYEKRDTELREELAGARAEERERCARVCEKNSLTWESPVSTGMRLAADSIRNLSDEPASSATNAAGQNASDQPRYNYADAKEYADRMGLPVGDSPAKAAPDYDHPETVSVALAALRFGCPFSASGVGEYDVQRFESRAIAAARVLEEKIDAAPDQPAPDERRDADYFIDRLEVYMKAPGTPYFVIRDMPGFFESARAAIQAAIARKRS